jgi:hypothetical protein
MAPKDPPPNAEDRTRDAEIPEKIVGKPRKIKSMIAETRRRLFSSGFPTPYRAMNSPFRRFGRDSDDE